VFELDHVGLVKGDTGILHDICLAVDRGECLVLAGENGAGKSSLLRLFNRLDEPTTGSIRFMGTPLPDIPVDRLRRQVGMVMQGPTLPDGTVREVLTRFRDVLGLRFHPEQLLAGVGLHTDTLDKRTVDLSGGETQLIALALVMERDPEVLLLDEPAAALSPPAMERMEALLCDVKRRGRTLIQVTHHVDRMLDLADRGVFLENGRVKLVGNMKDVAACFNREG